MDRSEDHTPVEPVEPEPVEPEPVEPPPVEPEPGQPEPGEPEPGQPPPPEPGGPGTPDPRALERRVVVKLAEGSFASEDDLQRRATELAAEVPGGRVVRVSRRGRVILLVGPEGDPAAAAEQLGLLPGVEYAERDVVDRAQEDEAGGGGSSPEEGLDSSSA